MPVDLANLQASVTKKDGAVDLAGCDYIGLYFSAHWCPPCRQFTPELAEYYTDWQKKGGHDGKKFEIIFLSSDRDEAAFDEYFATMPWAALKFNDRETKQKLSEDFGVRGIPTLVILDKKGETVTQNGRGQVMQNKAKGNYSFDKS